MTIDFQEEMSSRQMNKLMRNSVRMSGPRFMNVSAFGMRMVFRAVEQSGIRQEAKADREKQGVQSLVKWAPSLKDVAEEGKKKTNTGSWW